MAKSSKFGPDPHFKHFVESLEFVIAGYERPKGDFTAYQKGQVEGLVDLENKFRQALIKTQQGRDAYQHFVHHIMDEKRHLLAARPYFRERQEVFRDFISPALRARQDKSLYQFGINYNFVDYVLRNFKFQRNSIPARYARDVFKARQELIEVNMPLAISRARIFRKATPESHMEYMDLVQTSMLGLTAAVDKFVLPYTPVFRAVIIGRAVGNMIDAYSATMLHFKSSDKTKLYRANKARARGNELTPEQIACRVNSASTDGHNLTTESEIASLMSASSHVSADQPMLETVDEGEDMDSGVERYAAPNTAQPDVLVEEAQLSRALRRTLNGLPLFERKLIQMYGIDL